MRNNQFEDWEDEKLMALFVMHREEKAFICLYQRYFLSLTKYLTWLINDQNQAKDMVQNIFLKIYQSPTLFDTTRTFRTWLFVIAKNRWKNELRSKINREKHAKVLALIPQESEEKEEDHRLKNLSKALTKLSESHREVFVLKYSNGLTMKEIAQVLECSEGTVKSRLFYALKKTKTLLEKKELQG